MGKAEDRRSEPPKQAGPVARDLGRLKADGAEATAELREFLGRMRGRSAQEMLGVVAESRLTRSIVLATFLCILLLGALTVGPYAMDRLDSDASASASEEEGGMEPESRAQDSEAEGAGEPAEPAAVSPGTDADADPEIDPERAADAMGIGETRVADPDDNPLEDKLDKLLDGIE